MEDSKIPQRALSDTLVERSRHANAAVRGLLVTSVLSPPRRPCNASIGSFNQPDSFSAKLRGVGLVCSWQCSPFRALSSVLNSPRNRCKSSAPLPLYTELQRVDKLKA